MKKIRLIVALLVLMGAICAGCEKAQKCGDIDEALPHYEVK